MVIQSEELFEPPPLTREFIGASVPAKMSTLTFMIYSHRNGKIEGMGITHPSVAGQERVVRHAYEKANIDPNLTAYAELHGTGTPVGDPIEVRATSRAMNDTRPKDKPLLVGAVRVDSSSVESSEPPSR